MKKTRKMIVCMSYAALCVALAFLLPFITGNNRQLGNMLSLMHIPVFLCGLICGPVWGGVVGFVSPLLRTLLVGMPPFPAVAVPMAFELLAYGIISGVFNRFVFKKLKYPIGLYLSLIVAMILGRLVGGGVQFIMAGINNTTYSFGAMWTAYFATALPGIALHIVVVPLLVMALRRAKLTIEE